MAKLKMFDPPRYHNSIASVSLIDRGVVSFSKKAATLLGLPKNKLTFYQDPDNPSDWYIKAGPDCLMTMREVGESWGFNNIQLVREIKSSLAKYPVGYKSFPIATQPVNNPDLLDGDCYAILTSHREIQK